MLVFIIYLLLLYNILKILSCSKEGCLGTLFYFFKDFIYLFLKRGEGRKKERERNIDVREKH